MAEHAHITPAHYRLGHHPRRPDHRALLAADGTLANTFHLDATRQEIAGILRARGILLHDDDTVTQGATEPAPTRRGVLAACAGAAIAGAALVVASPDAAATEHPDATLLAACAHYERLEAEYRSTEDEEGNLVCPDGHDEAWNTIADLPATTFDGMRAKARALITYHAPDFQSGNAVMWSLIEDVAGESVA